MCLTGLPMAGVVTLSVIAAAALFVPAWQHTTDPLRFRKRA
jgi:hypothetical protein